jgi:branched-chain amino acid aminotransferase
MCPGLNYGQQCYEGLKAFRDPDDKSIHIFRPDMNAERIRHSAKFVSMPPVPQPLFLKAIHMAVAKNAEFVPPHASGASMYIRPLQFGSSAQLGLNPPEEYTFCVFVLPVGVYHGVHPVNCLVLEDFDRAAPEGTGSAKIGGNYAPVLIHSEAARKKGYGITLHLDSKTRKYIDEFSTSAFLAINYYENESKTKLTMPFSKSAIKSVTADSIKHIAMDLGWEIETKPVEFEELDGFDEVMAAGTAASLVPIKSIHGLGRVFDYSYGDQNPKGVIRLLEILKGIQAGTLEDKHGWRQKVNEV